MSRRKRVEMALEHREPDRVPWDCSLTVGAYDRLKAYLGLKSEKRTRYNLWLTAEHEMEVIEALDIDLYYVSLRRPAHARRFDPEQDTYMDEFGVTFRRSVGTDGRIMFDPLDEAAPLKDSGIDELEDYPWPDPKDPERIAGLREEVSDLFRHTDFALVGKFDIPPFTQAMFMRGAQQWYLDLALDREFARALLHRLAEIAAGLNENALDAVGEFLTMLRFSGDDFGGQNGMLISPSAFREVVKPALRIQYSRSKEAFRRRNPRGRIFNHSCGDVFEIIPDFLDLGLDVLNNLQPVGAMEHRTIKRLYGSRLSFHGGIDVQHVLPFLSPAEVYEKTVECMHSLGAGGGFILAPTIHVLGDVSPENILAMREAVRRRGRYPLVS